MANGNEDDELLLGKLITSERTAAQIEDVVVSCHLAAEFVRHRIEALLGSFSVSSKPASRITRRCLETSYWETCSRSAISFTLNGSLNSKRRMRSLVSSPSALSAAIQSKPVIALVIPG